METGFGFAADDHLPSAVEIVAKILAGVGRARQAHVVFQREPVDDSAIRIALTKRGDDHEDQWNDQQCDHPQQGRRNQQRALQRLVFAQSPQHEIIPIFGWDEIIPLFGWDEIIPSSSARSVAITPSAPAPLPLQNSLSLQRLRAPAGANRVYCSARAPAPTDRRPGECHNAYPCRYKRYSPRGPGIHCPFSLRNRYASSRVERPRCFLCT